MLYQVTPDEIGSPKKPIARRSVPMVDITPDGPETRSPVKHKPFVMPERTLPMIPEMCFATSTDNPNPFGFNTMLDDDGLSPLLVCEDCNVCVHASEFHFTFEKVYPA